MERQGNQRRITEFWSRAVKNANPAGCWEWSGKRDASGYGLIGRFRTHRFAYKLLVGPIPEGMFVCHRCDNPPCCNPSHLFLGQPLDNVLDMMAKHRHAVSIPSGQPGSKHGQAKLSEADVLSIRASYAAGGVTQRALADTHGVSLATINTVLKRRGWTHI